MSLDERLRVQLRIPANDAMEVAGREICSLIVAAKGHEKSPDFESMVAAAVLPRESLTVAFILNPFDREPGDAIGGFRRASSVARGGDAFTGAADLPLHPLFAVAAEELVLFRTSQQCLDAAFADPRTLRAVAWWRLDRRRAMADFIELTEWLGMCLTYAESEDNFELFGSESAMLTALGQLREAFDHRG